MSSLQLKLAHEAIRTYDRVVQAEELDPYDTLTQREREVLHVSADGHTANYIAMLLDISARTVEAHVANLRKKLRIDSRSRLIRYAVSRERRAADS